MPLLAGQQSKFAVLKIDDDSESSSEDEGKELLLISCQVTTAVIDSDGFIVQDAMKTLLKEVSFKGSVEEQRESASDAITVAPATAHSSQAQLDKPKYASGTCPFEGLETPVRLWEPRLDKHQSLYGRLDRGTYRDMYGSVYRVST
uniref:Uncharacterized protein n=1 Tax=Parascaris univalens TaxID=6257 RepID=A0A915CKE4_PARUN